MNRFRQSLKMLLAGTMKTYRRFPVVMGAAVAFTILALFSVGLEAETQERYQLLLTSLQLALAMAAVSGLACISFVRTRNKSNAAFVLANIAALLLAAISFFVLFFWSRSSDPNFDWPVLDNLARARMLILIVAAFFLFLAALAHPEKRLNFSTAAYLVQIAGLMALVYGIVIGTGLSTIVLTVRTLLWSGLSDKLYAYVSILSSFIAFTVFVASVPLRDPKDLLQPPIQNRHQAPFVRVLLEYVAIPIFIALNVVLLAWVLRILLPGTAPLEEILSGTTMAFALGSIYLHIMVTDYPGKLASFYRRFSPYSLILILAVSAIAFSRQIAKEGLTGESYAYVLIVGFAVVAAILLIPWKERAHIPLVFLAVSLLIFAILPLVGAADLPQISQGRRLERILTDEGMLQDGQIVAADEVPDNDTRTAITRSVQEIAWSGGKHYPDWFEPEMANNDVFRRTFGFEIYDYWDDDYEDKPYRDMRLTGSTGALKTAEYDWVSVFFRPEEYDPWNDEIISEIDGRNGQYLFTWITDGESLPRFTIERDGETIYDETLDDYIDRLLERYPLGSGEVKPQAEDMVYAIRTEGLDLLLYFDDIMIAEDAEQNSYSYLFSPRLVLAKED